MMEYKKYHKKMKGSKNRDKGGLISKEQEDAIKANTLNKEWAKK